MLQQYNETFLSIKFQIAYFTKLIGFGIVMQIIAFFSAIAILNITIPEQEVLILRDWLHIVAKNYLLGFFHKPLIEYDREVAFEALKAAMIALKYPFAISFIGWLMPLSLHRWLKRKSVKGIEEHQIGGSEIIPILQLIKKLKKQPSKLKIGGLQDGFILLDEDKIAFKENKKQEKEFREGVIPVPTDSELRHFLVIGRSGAGKTVLLNPTIEQLKQRQEKMLIHDFKGDMVTKFFNPLRDFIFNPLDKRCLQWNVWNDIQDEIDIINISSSLFYPNSKDPYWDNAARDVFEAILVYLYRNGLTTNRDIYEHINMPAAKILQIVSETSAAAANHISDPNGKQTQGVMSKLTQGTKCFNYLKDIDGDFSVKNWIRNYKDSTIFLVNYADLKDVIIPALTLFMDIAARTTLTLTDDLDRRIFFFLDEFGQLNRMNSLIDILTNGRSKGASIWLAIQDIGQIDEKYGHNLRKTIINAFSNYVVFALNDHETAKFFVSKIGERKVIAIDEMIQHNADSDSNNMGVRRSQKTENLVLSSDIMNLPDRQAFIKLSGVQEYSKMKVYLKNFENVADRLVR